MRESIEFRVNDDAARQWLPDDVGVRMGMARKLIVDVGDPLMGVIADAHRSMVAQGTFFVTEGRWRYSIRLNSVRVNTDDPEPTVDSASRMSRLKGRYVRVVEIVAEVAPRGYSAMLIDIQGIEGLK